MNGFATNLIGTFGGTTATSRLTEVPISTIHSWKSNGIPASRLAHLKLVARAERIEVDWETGLPVFHAPSDTAAVQHDAPGKAGDLTDQRSGGAAGGVAA